MQTEESLKQQLSKLLWGMLVARDGFRLIFFLKALDLYVATCAAVKPSVPWGSEEDCDELGRLGGSPQKEGRKERRWRGARDEEMVQWEDDTDKIREQVRGSPAQTRRQTCHGPVLQGARESECESHCCELRGVEATLLLWLREAFPLVRWG